MRNVWVPAILMLACCGGQPSVVERAGEPAVVNFQSDDREMDAAIRAARESVKGFIAELPRLRERGEYFSVKVPIQVGSNVEHVWLTSLEFRDGSFYGALGNEPLAGPSKLGDQVSTPVTEISDWMAVRNGKLFGGFTVLVARSRMSPAQRNEFDESVGFTLPASARPF
jgi:uncharacterized protein YegJ (DUF2314 family)